MNRDRHPIPDAPNTPIESRVHHLEVMLAQVWDLLWWIRLPWYRRLFYWCQGFRAPIKQFYEER